MSASGTHCSALKTITSSPLDNDPNHQNPLKAKIAAVDAKASFTPENVYFQKDRVEQVFGVKLTLERPGGFAKPGMPADAEIPLLKMLPSEI